MGDPKDKLSRALSAINHQNSICEVVRDVRPGTLPSSLTLNNGGIDFAKFDQDNLKRLLKGLSPQARSQLKDNVLGPLKKLTANPKTRYIFEDGTLSQEELAPFLQVPELRQKLKLFHCCPVQFTVGVRAED